MSNASLLDEATAAAEAMYMAFQNGGKQKTVFCVAGTRLFSKNATSSETDFPDDVHPQTLAVVQTRAEAIGVIVKVSPWSAFDLSTKNC